MAFLPGMVQPFRGAVFSVPCLTYRYALDLWGTEFNTKCCPFPLQNISQRVIKMSSGSKARQAGFQSELRH